MKNPVNDGSPFSRDRAASTFNLGIHSMLCPRIEVDFLETWIRYHVGLGVKKIFIYNSGPKIHYKRKNQFIHNPEGGKPELIKLRRPYLDADTRSDEEIMEIWRGIINKFKGVVQESVVDYADLGRGYTAEKYPIRRATHDYLQGYLNSAHLTSYAKEGYDWIANIDGDEFLAGNLSYLGTLPAAVSQVVLTSKYYPERWDSNGVPRANFLTQQPSLLRGAPPMWKTLCKNIVRPQHVTQWKNVHYGVVLKRGP